MKKLLQVIFLVLLFTLSSAIGSVNGVQAAVLGYECEKLTILSSSGDTTTIVDDTAASGGAVLRYMAKDVGDYVELAVNVAEAGTYNVKVRYRVYTDRGIVQHTFDGVNLGGTVDLYSATLGYKEFNLGSKTFSTSGTKSLKFVATGKNASSTSYAIYPDSITLTKSGTNTFECESLERTSSGDTTTIVYDDAASGGAVLRYLANEVGDYVALTMNVSETGTFNIKVKYRVYNDRAQVQHKMDGVNQGGVVDLYKANLEHTYYDLGNITFTTTGNKTLRIEVTGKNASSTGYFIYPDAIFLTKYIAGEWDYEDSFESDGDNTNPSHWIEQNTTEEWKVYGGTGTREYKHASAWNSAQSWLHVFEKDVEFQTRFKFSSYDAENARLRVAVRYNDVEACIFAGYNFNTSTWHIVNRQDENDDWHLVAESPTESLEPNTWYNIKVVAKGTTCALYVNDMQNPKLTTGRITHVSPGRVALSAGGTVAYFDDVKLKLLSNQGRVEDGVLEYTLGGENDSTFREGASIVEKNNGTLELLHRNERFTSTDNGKTFSGPNAHIWPYDGHGHHNMLRLQSGKLLKMHAEYENSNNEALRYRTKISADDGATWSNGGLTWTAYRHGPPHATLGIRPEALVMNDKLSQIQDGRLFFVVTIREFNSDGSIYGHHNEIYYSDNEGASWTQSSNNTSTLSSLRYDAEGKVIETSTGQLRLYVPRNEADSIMYSESSDHGVTWSAYSPADNLKNAASSFGLVKDPYASGMTYYMVWLFDRTEKYPDQIMFPRSRLALAKSTDGIHWTYMMDVDRWVSRNDAAGHPTVQMLDPSITVTQNYIYITMGRSEKDDPDSVHNYQKLRVYRLEKAKLQPYASWPAEY